MKFEDCRFGLVVRHGMYGLGMIEVLVPKNQTVNVCFETECVNMSPYDLELLGDIRIFEWEDFRLIVARICRAMPV